MALTNFIPRETLVTAAWLNEVDGVIVNLKTLINALDDAAASALGVPIGGFYRNGSIIQIRVT